MSTNTTTDNMDEILESFNSLTAKSVKYLEVQKEIKDDIKNLVKTLYDFTKSQEVINKKKKNVALPQILIEDFDEEQIWQQVELQNTECWDQLVWDVAQCISNKDDLIFPVEIGKSAKKKKKRKNINPNVETDTKCLEEILETKPKLKLSTQKSHMKKAKGKPSIVDDQFFKLNEMEKFLIHEEKNEGKSKSKQVADDDDESIDLFEDFDSEDEDVDDGQKDVMYNDFFQNDDSDQFDNTGQNDNSDEDGVSDVEEEHIERVYEEENQVENSKKVRFADLQQDSNSDNDSDNDSENIEPVNGKLETNQSKSEFEMRQERLKQHISKLEEKTLKEAPWQLKGEVDANKRPQNSLLQEIVDFDLTTRPAPIITEQTTVTLEGLIHQRIKDKAWDDVTRKEKPVDDQLAFKKPEILDHSKSKLSLAQVYEAEYLKQKQAMSGEIDESEPEIHKEIRDSMTTLFNQLDALCHYHYTPKPPQAEVKIVSNTPAISMEEVAPVATSDAALLAPEEIKKKPKGDLMSKEERTSTDKKRERRKKKLLQKQKGQVSKVTDNRNTMKGVESNDKSLKTSKAFFQQLNDDRNSLIKNKAKNYVSIKTK
ncbi:U3 small nucleolar ribonucleoprotein protein MPP10-like [Leptidea sinapis]|uniref:U3 small nucleolar ribonucleoprotein protein MPP10-like n=1 Tax=Leptidea sinapis TaxID=189913 RepID=UPI0021C36604|nr:U3 small nucleolar ribonucleoprotein protein MPP10-like [Leptidea sinapis]